MPATPESDHSSSGNERGTGKPSNFCVPCAMNRNAVTMRRTLSSRGDQGARREFMRAMRLAQSQLNAPPV